MLYTSNFFGQRHPRYCSLFSGSAALGLVALTCPQTFAQPNVPAPPTATQRLEQQLKEELKTPPGALFQRPVEVQSRALSPDGKVAVNCSTDGTVTLWDTSTGKDLHVLPAYEATDTLAWGHDARFSPDGRFVLTIGTIKLPPQPNTFVTFISQGKLWDVASGKLIWTSTDGLDDPKEGAIGDNPIWSPDGKVIATKSATSPVCLWDASSGKLLRTLKAPFMQMDAITFSPDGRTLVGGGYHFPSYASEIVLWDVQSGELKGSLKQPDPTVGMLVKTVAFSPDGKLLALGGGFGKYERINTSSGRFNVEQGVVQLWDVKSSILLSTVGYNVHRSLVTKMAFSPDGARLATGSIDQTVGLWDTNSGLWVANTTRYGSEVAPETGTPRRQTKPVGAGIYDLVFSGDGKTLDVLSNDKTMRSWDVSSPSPESDPIRHVIPEGMSRYRSLAFAPDGHWGASGESEKYVRFWRLDELKETDSFIAHDDAIVQIAFAPFAPNEERRSGKAPLMATGSNLTQWIKLSQNTGAGYTTGLEVKLWNPESHELKHRMTFPEYSLMGLAISPGGEMVAALGGKNSPAPPGSAVVAGNGGIAFGVAAEGPTKPLSAEEAIRTGEGIILLWDAQTGELKQKVPTKGAIPVDLIFSPDGNTLVSDNDEAGVTLWNAVTGLPIRTLDDNRPPYIPGERRYRAAIGIEGTATLAFTADGTQLARSYRGTIKIWNIQGGELVKTIESPSTFDKNNTSFMALTPDGKTLAIASRMQPLKIWDVATGKLLWASSPMQDFNFMQMSPDGKTLAIGAGMGIRLWDMSKVAEGIVN